MAGIPALFAASTSHTESPIITLDAPGGAPSFFSATCLEPVSAALAGLVDGGQPLEDDAFEAEVAAGVGEGLGLAGESGRHAEVIGGQAEAVEQGPALGVGTAQQGVAGLPEHVEGDEGHRDGRD
jgi:hypothetical protein